MKKNISRNPLWPDWYNGKKIDEVQFGRAFLEQWPLKCVNGTLYTLDGSFQESRLFCQNRLPVKYDPKAPTPDRWLTFLHELLDEADIPTLQEYLGYCLIPSTKGQKYVFRLVLS